jgi:hypothetical protein
MNDDPGESTTGFSEERSAGGGPGETAQAFAQAAATRLTEAARDATRQARAESSKLADQASTQIKDFLTGKIGQGAGLAGEAVEAARAFADGIDKKAPNAARVVRDAADRLETAASGIGKMSPDDLLERAKYYARRDPVVFVGAAAALGFLAARLFKSAPVAPGGRTHEGRTRQ